MLRGRSASDSVLPSGDAPYSSREASCVGMLLDRVILGGPPTGLGTRKERCPWCYRWNYLCVCVYIHTEAEKCLWMQVYPPMLVLELRGREVGEASSGRVSESVILIIVWECLLSPFSFPSSSTWEAPLKLHRGEDKDREDLAVIVNKWFRLCTFIHEEIKLMTLNHLKVTLWCVIH